MNTIYVTQDMWEGRAMGRAVGETQCRRSTAAAAREDKVIDLTAWKAENLVELEEPDGPESGLGSYEGRELVRRPRRRHDSALVKGELAATLAVVGLMLAIMIRVLVF